MDDRGFFLTLQAIRRQLAAMPCELYLIRLIHQQTRKAFPGERLWTAQQLRSAATVRFLRARNREGCDVYVQPFAGDRNAGYVLVDLDCAGPAVIAIMRAHGQDPCVVVQTSPGRLQAWIRFSHAPLEPAVAAAASKLLAIAYGGDRASTGWCHLGRLAGFTNQKPARRTLAGYACASPKIDPTVIQRFATSRNIVTGEASITRMEFWRRTGTFRSHFTMDLWKRGLYLTTLHHKNQ